MKAKKLKGFSLLTACLAFSLLALGLILASCPDPGSGSGTVAGYRVIYHVGEGSGVPPTQSPVVAGTMIRLPAKETMQGPAGRGELSGWSANTGGTLYPPLANYIVNGNVDFTAQWKAPDTPPTPPNGTNTGGGTDQGANPGGNTGQGNSFMEQMNWIFNNVQSHGSYNINVSADENIAPLILSFGDLINVTITLKGVGGNRTLRLSANGRMFTVRSNVTFILDENITLQGHNQNTDSLVRVDGGTLVMNNGSTITGNKTNIFSGGGVFVMSGAFNMNGGIISNNTAGMGGGVCIDGSGTFAKTGGTITGYASDTVNGNRALNNSSHAVEAHVVGAGGGKFKSTTAGPGIDLFYNPTSGGWDN